MSTLLVVDDDCDARESLLRALQMHECAACCIGASSVSEASKILEQQDIDVVILDLCLDENRGVESGFEVLAHITSSSMLTRVIVLTGHGSSEVGVRALHLGAANFLEKPVDIEHISVLCRDAFAHVALRKSHKDLLQGDVHTAIIGESDLTKSLREELAYAASHHQSVFLSGETGTGKTLAALEIHRMSSCEGSFVRYQPGVGNAELSASELFGHTQGAYTGAQQAREGLLMQAQQGTLLLDEVDELDGAVQVALLGFLQDGRFRALGSDTDQTANVRIVTASNAEIEKAIAEGKVRSDFYYRIAQHKIRLPALRERKEDIKLLAQHALKNLHTQTELAVFEFDRAAMQKLHEFDWPGNVRELLACVEGAAYRASFHKRQFIIPDDIMLDVVERDATNLHERVVLFKKQLVHEVLTAHAGNQVHAAESLGIDRSTLRRILSK